VGWVKYQKGSFPQEIGQYYVIKYVEGTKGMAFFKAIPPSKQISLMDYRNTMIMEENAIDRVIYRKYKAWFDKYENEQKPEDILYWYKLDEMPEDEKS